MENVIWFVCRPKSLVGNFSTDHGDVGFDMLTALTNGLYFDTRPFFLGEPRQSIESTFSHPYC